MSKNYPKNTNLELLTPVRLRVNQNYLLFYLKLIKTKLRMMGLSIIIINNEFNGNIQNETLYYLHR